MRFLHYAVVVATSMFALPQAMACFTVYNAANQVVYAGVDPPIDMSYQIHQRLPAVFPGGHMVFDLATDCPSIDLRQSRVSTSYVTASGSGQPMRTPRPDRQ